MKGHISMAGDKPVFVTLDGKFYEIENVRQVEVRRVPLASIDAGGFFDHYYLHNPNVVVTAELIDRYPANTADPKKQFDFDGTCEEIPDDPGGLSDV